MISSPPSSPRHRGLRHSTSQYKAQQRWRATNPAGFCCLSCRHDLPVPVTVTCLPKSFFFMLDQWWMTSPTFTLGEEVKRRSNREDQGLHLQILGVTLLIALLLSAAATWLCHSCSSSRCQVSPPPPLPPDLPTGSAAPQQPCSAWSIWLYKPFLGVLESVTSLVQSW